MEICENKCTSSHQVSNLRQRWWEFKMPNEIYIPFRGRKIKFGWNLACKILFKSSWYIPFEMDAKKKLARKSGKVGTLTPTGSVQCGPGSDNDNNKKTNFSLSIAHIITLISCLNCQSQPSHVQNSRLLNWPTPFHRKIKVQATCEEELNTVKNAG